MRHSTDKHRVSCGCRSVGECSCNDWAEMKALDAMVENFSIALKGKLHTKMFQGKSGWDDPAWSKDEILRALRDHIDKGDMVDVAAFAMFLWNRN